MVSRGVTARPATHALIGLVLVACWGAALSQPSYPQAVWWRGTAGTTAVYGVKGVEHPDNTPGERTKHAFVAGPNNTLWLFGGVDSSSGAWSDLWRYNTTSRMWAWIAGPNTPGQNGVYGTAGVSDPLNNPGSRSGHVMFFDRNGTLWLFGGSGKPASGVAQYTLNDLWSFDFTRMAWTWHGGASTSYPAAGAGVYGALGLPSGGWPGGRNLAAFAFDGGDGLYVFGGVGYGAQGPTGPLQDLWRLNLSTQSWTWLNGSSSAGQRLGSYGSQGMASLSNVPGSRSQTAAAFTGGKFWLFGGLGFGAVAGAPNALGDLWCYDVASGQWTWMSGYSTAANAYGVYDVPGVFGVAGPARFFHSLVADSLGRLWLFGGRGLAQSGGVVYLSDLWQFDPARGGWAFMNGGSTGDEAGQHSVAGTVSASNWPAARSSHASALDSTTNQVWTFGGSNVDAVFGDLWELRIDPNACESSPCRMGGTCVDLVGSFRCECPIGTALPLCTSLWCDASYVELRSAADSIRLDTLDADFGLSARPFSFCAWIRPQTLSDDKLPIVRLGPDTPYGLNGLYFGFVNRQLYFELDSTSEVSASSSAAYLSGDVGSWHHYCFTFNTLFNLRIYRDGVQISQTTLSTFYAGNEGPLIVGGSRFSVDEVRFYKSELSAAAIRGMFDGSGVAPTANAMLYLPFDDMSGPTVADRGPLAAGNTPIAFDPPTGPQWASCKTCATIDCQHRNTSCTDAYDFEGALCTCQAGYWGRACEFDACSERPCANGGTCTAGVGSHTCACASGFAGSNCTTNVDECASAPCANGGTCTDAIAGFQCACTAGWSGAQCQSDVAECDSQPCANGGTCVEGPNRFTCSCPASHSGAQCQTNVDECASAPCAHGGTCTDGDASFTCACVAGYSGAQCASNTDECASSPCGHGGTCHDAVNGYSCACVAGRNGANCETDIDECTSAPCAHGGTCDDRLNGYQCRCVAGWGGPQCQSAIDECASAPCANGGTCVDGVNSYQCTCVAGYEGVHCETDTNECASVPCANGGTCDDDVNGFHCLCIGGWSGPQCQSAIDECASAPCANGGTCVDAHNGYSCACVAGFSGAQCETDVDECASAPCSHGGTCRDDRNGYTCTCVAGFSGVNCETDVNECASGPCANGGTCDDDGNGFHCLCIGGWSGPQCQSAIDECASAPCANGGTCVDEVNGYHCDCPFAYAGGRCQSHIASSTAPSSTAESSSVASSSAVSSTAVSSVSSSAVSSSAVSSSAAPSSSAASSSGVSSSAVSSTAAPSSSAISSSAAPSSSAVSSSAVSSSAVSSSGVSSSTAGASPSSTAAAPLSSTALSSSAASSSSSTGGGPMCPAGWAGPNCRTNIDECASSPCGNGGVCVDGVNRYVCVCVLGYHGSGCGTRSNHFVSSSAAIRVWFTAELDFESGSLPAAQQSFIADLHDALAARVQQNNGIPLQMATTGVDRAAVVAATAGATGDVLFEDAVAPPLAWTRYQFDMFSLPNGTNVHDAYHVLTGQIADASSVLRAGAITSRLTANTVNSQYRELLLCPAPDRPEGVYWDVECGGASDPWDPIAYARDHMWYSLALAVALVIVAVVLCCCCKRKCKCCCCCGGGRDAVTTAGDGKTKDDGVAPMARRWTKTDHATALDRINKQPGAAGAVVVGPAMAGTMPGADFAAPAAAVKTIADFPAVVKPGKAVGDDVNTTDTADTADGTFAAPLATKPTRKGKGSSKARKDDPYNPTKPRKSANALLARKKLPPAHTQMAVFTINKRGGSGGAADGAPTVTRMTMGELQAMYMKSQAQAQAQAYAQPQPPDAQTHLLSPAQPQAEPASDKASPGGDGVAPLADRYRVADGEKTPRRVSFDDGTGKPHGQPPTTPSRRPLLAASPTASPATTPGHTPGATPFQTPSKATAQNTPGSGGSTISPGGTHYPRASRGTGRTWKPLNLSAALNAGEADADMSDDAHERSATISHVALTVAGSPEAPSPSVSATATTAAFLVSPGPMTAIPIAASPAAPVGGPLADPLPAAHAAIDRVQIGVGAHVFVTHATTKPELMKLCLRPISAAEPDVRALCWRTDDSAYDAARRLPLAAVTRYLSGPNALLHCACGADGFRSAAAAARCVTFQHHNGGGGCLHVEFASEADAIAWTDGVHMLIASGATGLEGLAAPEPVPDHVRFGEPSNPPSAAATPRTMSVAAVPIVAPRLAVPPVPAPDLAVLLSTPMGYGSSEPNSARSDASATAAAAVDVFDMSALMPDAAGFAEPQQPVAPVPAAALLPVPSGFAAPGLPGASTTASSEARFAREHLAETRRAISELGAYDGEGDGDADGDEPVAYFDKYRSGSIAVGGASAAAAVASAATAGAITPPLTASPSVSPGATPLGPGAPVPAVVVVDTKVPDTKYAEGKSAASPSLVPVQKVALVVSPLSAAETKAFAAFQPITANLHRLDAFFACVRAAPRASWSFVLENYLYLPLTTSAPLCAALLDRWTDWILPLLQRPRGADLMAKRDENALHSRVTAIAVQIHYSRFETEAVAKTPKSMRDTLLRFVDLMVDMAWNDNSIQVVRLLLISFVRFAKSRTAAAGSWRVNVHAPAWKNLFETLHALELFVFARPVVAAVGQKAKANRSGRFGLHLNAKGCGDLSLVAAIVEWLQALQLSRLTEAPESDAKAASRQVKYRKRGEAELKFWSAALEYMRELAIEAIDLDGKSGGGSGKGSGSGSGSGVSGPASPGGSGGSGGSGSGGSAMWPALAAKQQALQKLVLDRKNLTAVGNPKELFAEVRDGIRRHRDSLAFDSAALFALAQDDRSKETRQATQKLYAAGDELTVDEAKKLRAQCTDLLGEGSFGRVYRVKWMGFDCALKVLPAQSGARLAAIQSEIDVNRGLRAKRCVMFRAAYTKPPEVLILTDFLSGGDLNAWLHGAKRDRLTPALQFKFAVQIAEGLTELHAQRPAPLVHRDLKPSNVMLDRHDDVQLCDFGLAHADSTTTTVADDRAKTSAGTDLYKAPETWEANDRIGTESDVYSLGIVLHELFGGGQVPWGDKSKEQLWTLHLKKHEPELLPALRTAFPTVARIVESCLRRDRKARPTAEEVAQRLRNAADEYAKANATAAAAAPTLT